MKTLSQSPKFFFCLFLGFFFSVSLFGQNCPAGQTNVFYESFDCGGFPDFWVFDSTNDGGGSGWKIDDNDVVVPPPSGCWAIYDEKKSGGTNRTATLISLPVSVASYTNLNVSFSYGFNQENKGESLSFSLMSSQGNEIFWTGSEWSEFPSNWLWGVGDDLSGTFSQPIPASFLKNNTGLAAKWYIDDNTEKFDKFAVDDFLLCSNETCTMSLDTVNAVNANACSGDGQVSIELEVEGISPYTVTLGGTIYQFSVNNNILTNDQVPVGNYYNVLVEDDAGCHVVGAPIKMKGPVIQEENFEDGMASGWTFNSTGGGPGWTIDSRLLKHGANAGEPQDGFWAAYREDESDTERTATIESPPIDVSEMALVDLSFYYGYDKKDDGAAIVLSIHNGSTTLYWDGNTNVWVANSVDWLTDSDAAGVFSSAIPPTFLNGNSPFYVKWQFEDNDKKSIGFAIDNFSLCGELACTIDLASPLAENPTTCGETGSITIPINNATATSYEITVNGMIPSFSVLADSIYIDDIPVGENYTIVVTNTDGGCSQTFTNIDISNPEFSATLGAVNPTCENDNGMLTTTINTGTNPYTYLWNDSNSSTEPFLTTLNAGSYTVTITDVGSNCTTVLTETLVNSGSVVTAVSFEITQPTACEATGIATVSHNAGINVDYLWDNSQTAATAIGLMEGNHSLSITNNDGISCTSVHSVMINPAPATLTIGSPITQNVSCPGSSDGSISGFAVAGGVAPYQYIWVREGIFYSDTIEIFNIPQGNYILAVTDADACITTTSVVITEPDSFETQFTVTNVACSDPTGAIDLTILTGGNPPYTYNWSNGATTENISNLVVGTYTLTVTDAEGCTFATQTAVNSDSPITATAAEETSVSCNGGTDGTANISVTGGTATYLWDNGQTSANASGLSGGTHFVTVTDSNGCISVATVNITQPDPITSTTEMTSNATCEGVNNGTATISTSGGTAPYTFLWDNGESGPTATALAAGPHDITITDDNGCQTIYTTQAIGTEGGILLENSLIEPVNCNGESNGQISLTPTNGTGNYTFNWSNGDNTATPQNLAAGSYTLTITDTEGCTLENTFMVGQPDILLLQSDHPDFICGESLIAVNVAISGGNNPFTATYLWNDGSTTPQINALVNEAYALTVTDEKNCTANLSFTIGAADSPALTAENPIEITIIAGEALAINLNDYYNVNAQYDWQIEEIDAFNPAVITPNDLTGITDSLLTQTLSLEGTNSIRSLGELSINIIPFLGQGNNKCLGDLLEINVKILPSDDIFFIPNLIVRAEGWGTQISAPASDYTMSVYNRSGAQVHSDDFGTPWEYNNLIDGVYYYIITEKTSGEKLKTGAVLLQE